MLIAVMLAVTLITGTGDALAQTGREGRPPASKVRNEDFYRGIYLAQGPVAERIPEIRDQLMVKPPKQHAARVTRVLDEFSARLIKSVREVDPSFLNRFGAAMRSGDHFRIDAAITEGAEITVRAIRNLPEIATLRAKIEKDPKYVDKLVERIRTDTKGEVHEEALRDAINLVAASETPDMPHTEASAAIVIVAAAAVVAATYIALAHAVAGVFNIAGAVTMAVWSVFALWSVKIASARSGGLHREQLVHRIATTRF